MVGKQEVIQKRASRQLSGLVTRRLVGVEMANANGGRVA
jgi:hypothetical protein